MILTFLITLLTKFGMEKIDAGRWARRIMLILILGTSIGVIGLFGWFFSNCGAKNPEDQNKNNTNIELDTIQGNRIEAKQKEVNENVKQAEINFNTSVDRDSNTFNGNFGAVRSRYCREFPNDSKCR